MLAACASYGFGIAEKFTRIFDAMMLTLRPEQQAGDAAADQCDQTLRFRITVIAYDGRDDWVEPHIMAARGYLLNNTPQVACISDSIYSSGDRKGAAKAGRLAARSRELAER